VIKFVCDLRKVRGFLWVIFNVLLSYGLDCNDINITINIFIRATRMNKFGKKKKMNIYQFLINEDFSPFYDEPFLCNRPYLILPGPSWS
jgi:hypothetical protein